ncbi:MAG: hypothetical protein A3H95_07195 [Acidobacteria bacterium RIFCSPLOWO2_02_FULL_64_15]|nr:MAG: hypothetical protein A3H95_07195 [Acidobacteria bacterium RIFCSPLOWO2_02_FULL_64_15]
MGRIQHLHEDRLFDCYLAERNREAPDPRIAEHLADCEPCVARYTELVALMDELRADADEATNAVFTPERLRAQQQHIERRIEHVGHAARVISFPRPAGGAGERHEAPPHSIGRFVAAAAAAGLFIGVALGASFGWQWRLWPSSGSSASAPSLSSPRPSLGTPMVARETAPPPDVADDAFWSEFELMLDRPATRELQPFDALTPRARDFVLASYR